MAKDLEIFGITVPALPASEISIASPDLILFPKPIDYPWNRAEAGLRKQAAAIGQQAAAVDLTLEAPPPNVSADFALAIHRLAKPLGKTPGQIAAELAADFNSGPKAPFIKAAAPTQSGYVNFGIDVPSFGNAVLESIEKKRESYGNENLGNGETVVIDCSSPNVAKYMSVGHLRSTVIGESLARIYRAGGYTVIRDNHLGDWGTQFGILGRAKELWGEEVDSEMPNADPVQKLYRLYVKINDEIEKEKAANPEGESALEKEGREWFRRLEQGDPRALELLKLTTKQSLQEFKRVYKLLGSEYEYYLGESFYLPMLPQIIRAMQKKNVATKDEREAVVVEFPEGKNIKNLVIQKSDGASLYSTRDLATLIARTAWFKPDKVLYVVGADQKDYFRQVFGAFDAFVGKDAPVVEHTYFGTVSLPEGKMSTRKGRVVFLEDVLNEAIARAKNKIGETDRDLSDKEIEQISRQIGVGAVIYMDLGQGRTRNIQFDWDQALSLEGNSAPYIQYSHARGKSVLRRAASEKIKIDITRDAVFDLPIEADLVKHLSKFPQAIARTIEANEPSIIAAFTYKAADLFNKFYKEALIIREKDPVRRNSRLRLTSATAQVIKNGLYLLGIEAPEKM